MTTLHERMQALRSGNVEQQRVEFGHDVPDDDVLADFKEDIHRHVIESLGPQLYRRDHDPGDLDDAVSSALDEAMLVSDRTFTPSDAATIRQELADEILAYGPITRFLRDPSVSEIMVNAFDTIYVERKGKIVKTEARFVSDAHLERIIQKIVAEVGRRIDESCPMVDARLPDGSRVNAIIAPLTVTGAALTIRKFRQDALEIEDLVKLGTLSHKAAQFLQMAVKGEANVLVSGGTGSGKTTTLNVLSGAIPENQRIITVEDAAELQLKQEHVIGLEARPNNTEGKGEVSIRDLVRNCLRMRPDRIVVGECRGAEAIDMLQAMNTGHDGSMTTIHANGPRDALMRLEMLVLMGGIDLPVRAIREQITAALDLIVHVERLVDGSRRVTSITEVLHLENDVIAMQDIFKASYRTSDDGSSEDGHRLIGGLELTGIKPQFLDKLTANGVNVPASLFSTDADISSIRGGDNWIMREAQRRDKTRSSKR